ncbi:hypothetical protein V8V91_20715 [Algoriphagus halophilus]|uniref:hypothetical protein n=1 Tax=Algoriphagus halophilus TaxID=226505 RepID=UPI00358F1607
MTTYFEQQGTSISGQEEKLFNYYKCLRANIRAKVYAIEISQSKDEKSKQNYIKEFKRYLSLIVGYLDLLNE